jgi:hypothetical protein
VSVIATDDFNRANGTGLGANWTAVVDNYDISSNRAVPSPTSSDAVVRYSGATWPNDQYSQAKCYTTNTTAGGAGIGVCARCSASATTLYRLVADHGSSSNWEIGDFIAGSYNFIANRTQAWTDGDTIRLEAQGTSLTIKLNGTAVGAAITSSAIASGQAGLAYSSIASAPASDDFEGGDFAAAFDPSTVPWSAESPSAPSVAVVGF